MQLEYLEDIKTLFRCLKEHGWTANYVLIYLSPVAMGDSSTSHQWKDFIQDVLIGFLLRE